MELGAENKKSSGVVITPNQNELDTGLFTLIYRGGNDTYQRGEQLIRGWRNNTFSSVNMQRKEELDWHKCYLARSEGAETGQLIWRFALNKAVTEFEVQFSSMLYENGMINAILCCGDRCARASEKGIVRLEDMEASSLVSFTVDFAGGRGPVAWQHAQLFRTDINSEENSMTVTIKFA